MGRHYRLLLASVPLVVLLGLTAAGVATAGGGCHQVSEAVATEGTATVVKMDGCTFAPTVTRVPVGAEVQFLNTSPTVHDVTGRGGSWGSGQFMQSGAAFSVRFAAEGVYPYSCSLHAGMAGVVIAGSPDPNLASDVQAAPIRVPSAAAAAPDAAVAAAANSGDSALPILAAGGLGVLAGALLTSGILARRPRAD